MLLRNWFNVLLKKLCEKVESHKLKNLIFFNKLFIVQIRIFAEDHQEKKNL